MATIHTQDSTVRIPEPGGKAEAPSWRVKGAIALCVVSPQGWCSTAGRSRSWVCSFSGRKRAQGEHPASSELGDASWEAHLSPASRGSLWKSAGLEGWGSDRDGEAGGGELTAAVTQLLVDHIPAYSGASAEAPARKQLRPSGGAELVAHLVGELSWQY